MTAVRQHRMQKILIFRLMKNTETVNRKPAQQNLQIRPMRLTDNERVAYIIRAVMPEFGCVGAGYSIEDPEVDYMYENYDKDKACFYVIVNAEDVPVGCGGIAPLAGGDGTICELQKMYFLSEARGKGFGRKLMDLLIGEAKRLGYQHCYLETVTRMQSANALYAKAGFKILQGQMGSTGHSGCDTFYLKKIGEHG